MEEEVKNEEELVEVKPVKEKKEFKALILYFLIIFGADILVTIGFFLKYGKMATEKIQQAPGVFTAIYMLVYLSILLVILLPMYRKKISADFKRTSKNDWCKFLLYGIGFYIVNIILSNIFVSILNVATSNQDSLNNAFNSLALVTFVPTAFFAPIIEEIVFRFAMGTIIKNKVVYVIVSSLLFAVMHGLGVITILYFALGVMLSLIYLKTDKNILASTTVHIFNNTISGIFSLLL